MTWLLTWSTYAAHPPVLSQFQEPPCQQAFLLDPPRRAVIVESLLACCTHSAWTPLALHVRTNHIHIVVSTTDPPARLFSVFKANLTRELRRAELASPGQSIWADYRHARRLESDHAVDAAVRYVLDRQGTPLHRWPA